MNENPCSNQEIHVLFEHGSELENTSNEPCIIKKFARGYLQKVLRTRLIISPMFLFTKTLRTVMRCDYVMTFESTQPTPFCLEKSRVRKWTNKCLSSVFNANWTGIR